MSAIGKLYVESMDAESTSVSTALTSTGTTTLSGRVLVGSKPLENLYNTQPYDFEKFVFRDIVYSAETAYYPQLILTGTGDAHSIDPKFTVFYSTGTVIKKITSENLLPGSFSAAQTCTGLNATAHHPCVLFSADCFGLKNDGTNPRFKMIYWCGTSSNLTNLHYADSYDGVAWSNDAAITQNDASHKIIVDSNTGAYNDGCYGFCKIFWQGTGKTNTGSDYRNYEYVAIYDCTQGLTTYQTSSIAVSADCKDWKQYRTSPILTRSTPDESYCSYMASMGTCWKSTSSKGEFQMLFSGGKIGSSNLDNGCVAWAHTTDLDTVFTKASTYIYSVYDSNTKFDQRCYTPSVVDDGHCLYCLFTCVGSVASGSKRLGLMTLEYDAQESVFAPKMFHTISKAAAVYTVKKYIFDGTSSTLVKTETYDLT